MNKQTSYQVITNGKLYKENTTVNTLEEAKQLALNNSNRTEEFYEIYSIKIFKIISEEYVLKCDSCKADLKEVNEIDELLCNCCMDKLSEDKVEKLYIIDYYVITYMTNSTEKRFVEVIALDGYPHYKGAVSSTDINSVIESFNRSDNTKVCQFKTKKQAEDYIKIIKLDYENGSNYPYENIAKEFKIVPIKKEVI